MKLNNVFSEDVANEQAKYKQDQYVELVFQASTIVLEAGTLFAYLRSNNPATNKTTVNNSYIGIERVRKCLDDTLKQLALVLEDTDYCTYSPTKDQTEPEDAPN